MDGRGSISGKGWDVFSSPPRADRFWVTPSLLSKGYGWKSVRGV